MSLRIHFTDRAYLKTFFIGLFFILLSVVFQFFASTYANLRASASVEDIVLSNTRVYDVDGIFVYGSVLIFVFIISLCLARPRYFPFAMKTIALFTFIRSIFVTLTHISPFPGHVMIESAFFADKMFRGIFTGDDLFFSGHTGIPFLMALMFWDNKPLRYIFLIWSLVFASVVLLGHLHYSIDVLSAFFITYSIYHIACFLFKRDLKLFSGAQA